MLFVVEIREARIREVPGRDGRGYSIPPALGGPWGRELRAEDFKRARAYVRDAFGDLT